MSFSPLLSTPLISVIRLPFAFTAIVELKEGVLATGLKHVVATRATLNAANPPALQAMPDSVYVPAGEALKLEMVANELNASVCLRIKKV